MATPEVRTLDELGGLKGDGAAVQTRVYEQKLDTKGRAYATGRRKDAVARVWVKPGAGKITINGRDLLVYFARPVLQMILKQPLVASKRDTQFDVVCTVERRRLVRAGRRRPPRHQPRPHPLRAGAPRCPQEGRLPHP